MPPEMVLTSAPGHAHHPMQNYAHMQHGLRCLLTGVPGHFQTFLYNGIVCSNFCVSEWVVTDYQRHGCTGWHPKIAEDLGHVLA